MMAFYSKACDYSSNDTNENKGKTTFSPGSPSIPSLPWPVLNQRLQVSIIALLLFHSSVMA